MLQQAALDGEYVPMKVPALVATLFCAPTADGRTKFGFNEDEVRRQIAFKTLRTSLSQT